MEKRFALVTLVAVAAGCYSAGQRKITDDKLIAQIEKGKSTKADVEKLLGRPAAVDFTESGMEKWVFTYMNSQVRGTTFIPIAGAFVGGSDMFIDTLTVLFTKAGVVENYGKGRTTGGGGGIQDIESSAPKKEHANVLNPEI